MQINAQIRLNTVRGKLNIRDMKVGAKVDSVVVILFKIPHNQTIYWNYFILVGRSKYFGTNFSNNFQSNSRSCTADNY